MRRGVWNSLAVRAGDAVVGDVMWAYDEEGGAHWIGGMTVGAAEQGRGVGRAAVRALVGRLATLPACREIRLSYHPDNAPAARLYAEFGFGPAGDFEDDEVAAVLAVATAAGAHRDPVRPRGTCGPRGCRPPGRSAVRRQPPNSW